MGLNFGQVRDWNVEAIEAGSRGHQDRIDQLQDVEDSLRSSGYWEVSESQGSRAVSGNLTRQADVVTDEAARSQHALNASRHLHNGAVSVKNMAKQLDAEASGEHFTISDNGTVTDNLPPAKKEDAAEKKKREDLKRDYEQRVNTIVREANVVANTAISELTAAATGKVSDGGATSVADAVKSQNNVDPPKRGEKDPIEVAAWWNSLDQSEKNRLLNERPQDIGNLDGVPSKVRGEANVKALPGKLDFWQNRLAELKDKRNKGGSARPGAQSNDARAPLDVEIDHVQSMIDDLTAAKSSATRPDGSPDPDRTLLLLDDASGPNLEAAVGVGDIDNSDNVSLTVPGFTTTVRDSLEGMVNEADGLSGQARTLNQGKTTASIAYIGYQAPQGLDVATNANAHQGATKVASALEGLSATTNVPEQHLTALGHSYGSDVTGIALQEMEARNHTASPVDDVVLYGSPGIENIGEKHMVDVGGGATHPPNYVDIQHSSRFGVSEGHSFYMSTPSDPVTRSSLAGKLGSVPEYWGMEELGTHAADTPLGPRKGPDPVHHLFGIFPHSNHQHSNYPDPDRTTGYNIAAVVSGAAEKAIR